MPGDKYHPYPWEFPCKNASGLVTLLESWGVDMWNFQPAQLFEAIEGRTLWLIGDSQARRLYRTIECFLSPFLSTIYRAAPTNSTSANMWLMSRGHKIDAAGDWRSPPETSICAEYRCALCWQAVGWLVWCSKLRIRPRQTSRGRLP